jgi:TetR/AcrR family transcriptional repressor of nem operon
MRYSAEHKKQTRERVLKEAAREIRAKGPGGVGVSAIMARAGLTHGGFYAHCPSKDALVEAALDTMFADARGKLAMTAHGVAPRHALRDYVAFYLSPSHRDARDHGCPLPSLSGDLARSEAAARDHFGQGLEELLGSLTALLAGCGSDQPGADATSLLSEMVGAVALARAVGSPEQSDLLLANARGSILARFNLEGQR